MREAIEVVEAVRGGLVLVQGCSLLDAVSEAAYQAFRSKQVIFSVAAAERDGGGGLAGMMSSPVIDRHRHAEAAPSETRALWRRLVLHCRAPPTGP